MADKQVVVEGGGENLYKVSDYKGIYYVKKISVGIIANSARDLGKTKSFDDALAIIRSHSGKAIKSIS